MSGACFPSSAAVCFFKVLLNWGISLNTSRGSYLAFFPLLSLVFLHANMSSGCQHLWQLVTEHSYSSHTHSVIHAMGSRFCSKYPCGPDKTCDCSLWLELKSKCHVRDTIWVFLFPLNTSSLVSVAVRSLWVCLWKHLSVCVVIIEAHLLLWECADVSLGLQCGLMLKGVYCFSTHKCCCGKRVWQYC